ncbi:MAG: ornithine racemase Orr [Clostridium sp.]|uniref:ornithine racemase Orr n=1 Tax=Clostridium sp. TaxID=1506 RepID=UPI003D6D4314
MRRNYPCIEVNLSKVTHNTSEIVNMCEKKGIAVFGVTKSYCANTPVTKAMVKGGIKGIADARIMNLKKAKDIQCEKLLLRIPMGSNAGLVVKYADISLNSEIDTIKKISKAAKRMKKTHSIILMIDLGDLREGVLEENVLDIVKEIITIDNIKLIGVGTNLTCYGGVIPDEDNLGKLIKIKEKIQQELGIQLPIVSGGNSSSLPLVMNDTIPSGVNQLRVGEAIVLGTETAYGHKIDNCHSDCFILKGEIIEVKNKPSVPTGTIGMNAFGKKPDFQDNGIIRRAIIALGRQDIQVDGIFPLDEKIKILGASSDHLILDITGCEKDYRVGDVVDFNMNYACLMQSSTSTYVSKYYLD